MRALLPLVMLLLMPLLAPSAAAGECVRVGPLATALTCERTGPGSCHFALEVLGTVVLDRSLTCPPHVCRPTDTGRVAMGCGEPAEPDGSGKYSTTVTAEFGAGETLPHGTLTVEFSRPAGDFGSTAGQCRARYEKVSGPGPSSAEFGRECAYPFLLP